jgi:hypothetical protein
VLSFREHLVGIPVRGHMMLSSDYPHSEATFPPSRKILAGVPDDEQAKPAPDPNPGIAGGNTACTILTRRA